jgi:hypothetical protein
MTTPQDMLQRVYYRVNEMHNELFGSDNEESHRDSYYDVMKSIETESTEFNERLQLLEDKMDLIIKLLGKS